MAKFEKTINDDFQQIISKIESEIMNGSLTATMEDSSDFVGDGARCSVRVFERYSAWGGNRVSLNVTLFQSGDGPIHISAITSGGSQALLYKWNTLGEEAFLDKLREII